MDFGPIVDPTSLASGADGPIFCDVRWYLDGRSGRGAYDAGHLPGAVCVDLEEHLTAKPGPEVGRHPLPDPDDLALSLGSLGIGPDDPVVAYDDAGGMSAGRLVWMLRILGQPAALLDGGIEGWDGPLEVQPSVRAPVGVPVRPWPTFCSTPEPLSVTGEMSSRWTPGLDTFRGPSTRHSPPTWPTVGSWPLKP